MSTVKISRLACRLRAATTTYKMCAPTLKPTSPLLAISSSGTCYKNGYLLSSVTQQIMARHYSNLPNPGKSAAEELPRKRGQRSLPRLMDFPEIIWPSTFKFIKNWVLVQFIIRPYFDREFFIRDFILGARHALQVISAKLYKGEFSSLTNLITSEAIADIKPIIEKMSVQQRQQLEIRESDIYLSFPYQVGIIFDDENSDKVQRRWVEITVVFHVLRGLSEMRERGEEVPWNMGTMPEYQDKVFVCNYRFIKEFTSGAESDWTVNVLNHFKPIDIVNENL